VNLRDHLHAAGDEAPLAPDGVDVDAVVRRARRGTAWRRTGAGSAVLAVAALAATVTSTGLTTASGPSAPRAVPPASFASAPGTSGPASITPSASAAPVLRLTAAELTGSGGKNRPEWLVLSLARDKAALDALAGHPCTLPAGATPGEDYAPAPSDTCTTITRDGATAWVRRWGYSPERSWTLPDSKGVDIFFRAGNGRITVLTVANTIPPRKGDAHPTQVGRDFDLPDSEIARMVPDLAHEFR
jgi:hypothetical protein